MLSHAAAVTGRGRGFAVHEALDQIGAIIGPLTMAGMLAITVNDYGPALGVPITGQRHGGGSPDRRRRIYEAHDLDL